MKTALFPIFTALCLLTMVSWLANKVRASPVDMEKRWPSVSKAGLAWPAQSQIGPYVFMENSQISWYYNWGTTPTAGITGKGFVPMVWGRQSSVPTIPPITRYVLGFNEPDLPDQSNMAMGEVIAQWKAYLAPLKGRVDQIGAPAFINDNNLKAFLDACNNDPTCTTPGFINLHVYQNTFQAFIDVVTQAHNKFGLNVFVTEYAMHNFDANVAHLNPTNVNQVETFMAQTTAWMEAQPWITRYSWFGAGSADTLFGVGALNRLQDDSGALTALGAQYVRHRTTV